MITIPDLLTDKLAKIHLIRDSDDSFILWFEAEQDGKEVTLAVEQNYRDNPQFCIYIVDDEESELELRLSEGFTGKKV